MRSRGRHRQPTPAREGGTNGQTGGRTLQGDPQHHWWIKTLFSIRFPLRFQPCSSRTVAGSNPADASLNQTVEFKPFRGVGAVKSPVKVFSFFFHGGLFCWFPAMLTVNVSFSSFYY